MLGVGLPHAMLARMPLHATWVTGGVIASVRGSSLRIAPHLHTTPADIARLAQALEAAARSTE